MAAITCLLIDDDVEDHEIFEDLLKKISSSFNYIKAFNGKEAIDKLVRHDYHPDVIFLDIDMPLMDGRDFLKEIKRQDELKNIPVVIFSTASNQRSKNEMLELGAVAFMPKPFKLIDWEEEIKRMFKKLFPGVK